MGYILSRATVFPKPDNSRVTLAQLTGDGVLVVEGEDHKRHRKILNPAFSPAQTREFAPIFAEKAKLLISAWSGIIAKNEGKDTTVDVLHWTGRAMLDVIGEAGFGYHFNALTEESNELATAVANLFKNMTALNFFAYLQYFFPPARLIPTRRNQAAKNNRKIIHRIGNSLISDKKAEVLQSSEHEKEDVLGRDLLSVLVKSNLATDALSQDEVLAQITTFVLAGHETTSTALAGFLYLMSAHLDIQNKLRQEVLLVGTDNPSIEDLNALPYLDKVLRETLRLYSPVTITSRVATQDDVLPVSEPYVDKNGKTCYEIRVQKGDITFLPLFAVNKSPRLWGPDSKDFIPERWESPLDAISAIPSVFSNLSSFLAGPRACIGWRMAVMEMKVFMFAMIRNFEFKIDPSLKITLDTVIVSRPSVVGREKEGNQLPLIVSMHKHDP
ncbi:hypothetical protein FRC03_007466 [Tulasnella sp. 419]|nr:hypothetical protein FRC03_007466 [Tulasnella sp. 419]